MPHSNFQNSKNILYHSPIHAKGNVHIGDIYHINGQSREIPLSLTTLPFISKKEVIGRDTDLENVKKELQASDKVVLVNGIGGIGKTTLAKYFLTQFRKKYNYVAWVENTANIKEGFVKTMELVDSLCLREEIEQLPQNKDRLDNAFSLIINRMRQLGGDQNNQKNLLIIDNANDDIEHTKTLDQISLRPNWKVLVTSREKLIGFKEYELGFLSPADAMQLFYLHYRRATDDTLVNNILEILDYHTLLIEVVAKTAQSLRLDLAEILDRLKKKGLHISKKAKIKFPHNYNQRVLNVFEYLLEMFEIAAMNEYERWVMMQFAILPSLELPYQEERGDNILDLLKIEKGIPKDNFTKALNKIVEKGWLAWNQATDSFKMHHLLQEVLLFKIPPKAEKFDSLIGEIYDRLNYQKVDLVRQTNTFAEAIAQKVKGASINLGEMLDEYASVCLRMYQMEKSIQLQKRAIKIKKKVLPENDEKLADSYNGLALSYLERGQYKKALKYQMKDLEIAKIHSNGEDYNIAISYGNLSLIYRKLRDFEQAKVYQDKALLIAEKINDIDLDVVVYNNMGNLELLLGNLEQAKVLFEQSLKIRLENDCDPLWISEAYANLAPILIEFSEFEKAALYLHKAFEIEENLVPDSTSVATIHHGYGLLYFKMEDYQSAGYHFQKSLELYTIHLKPNSTEVQRAKNWCKKIKLGHYEK